MPTEGVAIRRPSAALAAALVLHGLTSTVYAGDARPEAGRRAPLPRQPEPTRDQYAANALAQVRRSLFYPDQARREGQTGEVVVRVALGPEGAVLRAVVARSSGHRTLDQAAITAVLRASPFPPTPAGIPNPLTIEMGIWFMPGAADRR